MNAEVLEESVSHSLLSSPKIECFLLGVIAEMGTGRGHDAAVNLVRICIFLCTGVDIMSENLVAVSILSARFSTYI